MARTEDNHERNSHMGSDIDVLFNEKGGNTLKLMIPFLSLSIVTMLNATCLDIYCLKYTLSFLCYPSDFSIAF